MKFSLTPNLRQRLLDAALPQRTLAPQATQAAVEIVMNGIDAMIREFNRELPRSRVVDWHPFRADSNIDIDKAPVLMRDRADDAIRARVDSAHREIHVNCRAYLRLDVNQARELADLLNTFADDADRGEAFGE